jgi:arginase
VADLDAAADVVAFTVAEFIPRQLIHLQQSLTACPLISATTAS